MFNFEGLIKDLQEIFGGVAQLGEHLLCKQGVIGSIPFISTNSLEESKREVKGKSDTPNHLWAHSSGG